jgi:hypothetical protein
VFAVAAEVSIRAHRYLRTRPHRNSRDFDFLAQYPAQLGMRVIAPHLPGADHAVEIPGCGHAPSLMAVDQMRLIEALLTNEQSSVEAKSA